MLCDFCCADHPCWEYPADDFIAFAAQGSLGSWAACETCHGLIEAGDHDGLAQRSLATFCHRQELTRQESVKVLAILRDLHVAFRQHRAGPAIFLEK